MHSAWSDQDIQFLKDHYPQHKVPWIAEQLHRSVSSVYAKIQTGFKSSQIKAWTEEEQEFLRKHYPEHSIQWISEQLGRPFKGVEGQISKLGLQQWKEWTPIEDDCLRYWWGKKSIRVLAMELDRSATALGKRRNQLGLSISLPDGYESILSAEKRSGFSRKLLLKILSQYKVVPQPAPSRKYRPHRRMKIVKIEDVNKAITRYMNA